MSILLLQPRALDTGKKELLVSLRIYGVVQGVGFRPYVTRLANQFHLSGRVQNTPKGLRVHIQGAYAQVAKFLSSIDEESPPLSHVERIEIVAQGLRDPVYRTFEIARSSSNHTNTRVTAPPDAAICNQCIAELDNKNNRRYAHPLISCVDCGPRYSIIKSMPYDRHTTTMNSHPMCTDCSCEYDDPLSRRYHAQTISCKTCGPQLTLLNISLATSTDGDPVEQARKLLSAGNVLAVKGLTGFHLMADPTNAGTVAHLRKVKCRPTKPFALVARSLKDVRSIALLDSISEDLLVTPARPIVLLPRLSKSPIVDCVAPDSTSLGIMLCSTPLQYLLLDDNRPWLIATSANISSDSIATDDLQVIEILSGKVDYLLTHDRDIAAGVDDSVVRAIAPDKTVDQNKYASRITIRLGRGYAPLKLEIPFKSPPLVALGAELNASISAYSGGSLHVSDYIGDLKSISNQQKMQVVLERMSKLLGFVPERLVCDLHPQLVTSLYANSANMMYPPIRVQHHHAHLASCLAEYGEKCRAIGIIFDGGGYGTDGTIWGGEFLLKDGIECERVGHLRRFPLLGGDRASRETFRPLTALLMQHYGESAFSLPLPSWLELDVLQKQTLSRMFTRGINSIGCSSIGRVYDAVACLLGLCNYNSFEGEAAYALEGCLPQNARLIDPLPFNIFEDMNLSVLDLVPAIVRLSDTVLNGNSDASMLSLAFHSTIVHSCSQLAIRLCRAHNVDTVVLSGGVFGNAFLASHLMKQLHDQGFRVIRNTVIPPGDGGISIGQIYVAAEILNQSSL